MDKNETYNVLDVARVVINYGIEQNKPVNKLQLQKILYYIQVAFLTRDSADSPCFNEVIVNWKHGAVVESVCYEYKPYGYSTIKDSQNIIVEVIYNEKTFELERVERKFDENKIFKQSDLKLIKEVTKSYLNYDSFKLVCKILSEEPCGNGNRNEEISIDSMKKYYKKNMNKIYGEVY